jgi:hypothetical protein
LLIVDIIGIEGEDGEEVEWRGKARKGYYLNGIYTNTTTRRPSSVELATDHDPVLGESSANAMPTEVSSQWHGS